MRRGLLWAVMAAALLAAACDCLQVTAPDKSAPSQAAAPSAPDLRPYREAAYSDFVARPGMERYAPDAMGFPENDVTRFRTLMAPSGTPDWVSGGGAEALVFTGCAPEGCETAIAVLAIDAATGAPFVAVRDAEGADILAPSPRVEALLTLSSPSRRWDDPGWRGQE